ncbi:MAG: DNA repair protein RecO [Ruminococcaceae bacterium]|nr:DNA repair protein RecO [Oscillospiraceae bacterium]
MLLNVNGLIVRETPYGENDKIFTVLTPDYGKISVIGKGIRSYRNKNSRYARVLLYDELVLYKKNGNFYHLKEASPIEAFPEINDDLSAYSLAMYLCDIAAETCVEEEADHSEIIRLILNSLYLLAKGEKKHEQIKAVFELRLASLQGYMPDLTACTHCGKFEGGTMYLDVMNGVIKCGECFENEDSGEAVGTDNRGVIITPLSPSVLSAMRYIIYSDAKKIFSFVLTDDELYSLSVVCEKYIINQLERNFASLDFYKEVKRLDRMG